MCGIAGFIGPEPVSANQRRKRQRMVTALMLANVSRGSDAAGVAFICADGPDIVKGTGSAWSLVDRPDYRAGFSQEVGSIIGHTRLATHGENSNQNAHPFREKTIVGVHNGVITNHEEVDAKRLHGWKRPVEVDSQVVFRLLAGVRPTKKRTLIHGYAEVLPQLRGNMTLVWADDRDPGATYVFRHDNPLSMAIAPTARGAFVSSEFPPLCSAVSAMYGDDWESFTIEENKVYRFTWEEKQGIMYATVDVTMPSAYNYNGTTTGWGAGSRMFGTGGWRKLDSHGQWVEDDDPNGDLDSSEKFDKIMYDSFCTICDVTIDANDNSDGIERMNDGSVICGACSVWFRSGDTKDGKVLALPLASGEEVNAAISDKDMAEVNEQYGTIVKEGSIGEIVKFLEANGMTATAEATPLTSRIEATSLTGRIMSGKQKGAH